MKRVIKIDKKFNEGVQDLKYVLQQEYGGFNIYQEMCPNGYYKHQSYMITNGEVALLCHPYTEICKEELLDMIDSYNANKKFGIKGFEKGKQDDVTIYVAHQNGKVAL